MTYAEIIEKIRARDEKVTRCFFFWDGPTQEYIDDVRRTKPQRAQLLRRPVCCTCRPAMLSILHRLSDGRPFDYEEKVTSFYFYLMKDDKLALIRDPEALMGWIVKTAYFFFLKERSREQASQSTDPDSLADISESLAEDLSPAETRAFVEHVLAAMPNRSYAALLDDVVLEAAQYSGAEKAEVIRRKAESLGITIDHLYVKISLAKKQFRKTAETLILENEKQ